MKLIKYIQKQWRNYQKMRHLPSPENLADQILAEVWKRPKHVPDVVWLAKKMGIIINDTALQNDGMVYGALIKTEAEKPVMFLDHQRNKHLVNIVAAELLGYFFYYTERERKQYEAFRWIPETAYACWIGNDAFKGKGRDFSKRFSERLLNYVG